MIALRYPRGMEQYRDGEEVYMCLEKNTYGTPDSGFLWAEERTTMLFKHFSETTGDNHKVPNGPMHILLHLYHRDPCGSKRRFTQW